MRHSGSMLPLMLAGLVFMAAMVVMRHCARRPAAGERVVTVVDTPDDSAERGAARQQAGRAEEVIRGRSRPAMPERVRQSVTDDGNLETMVISLPPGGTLEAVADLAVDLGIDILGRDATLRALHVRATAGQLARLKASTELPLTTEENTLVYVPYIGQEAVREIVSGAPFGTDALAAIGVSEVGPDWGRGITVAVLDTGIFDHASLRGAAVVSFDLVQEQDPPAGPFAGHGTAVASLLAGNGTTVQGIIPGSEILSIKVVDSFGVGDAFSLASGMVLAVDHGATVINISLGSDRPHPILEEAVAYARERGVILVASAGNGGNEVLYPAAYEGVTAVGAIDANGVKEAYSNVGERLDLMAPGTGVVAAWHNGENVWMTGTSASAPFVSGALAVLLAGRSATSPAEALEALLRTANDAGAPGRDREYGQGVLDVRRALIRDEPGHVDAALADHYLPRREPVDGQIGVIVTAQNRGTDVIGAMTVVAEFAGHRLQRRFVNVLPGQTVSMPVGIAEDLVSTQDGLLLRSRVVASGDGNPRNNVRTSRIAIETIP